MATGSAHLEIGSLVFDGMDQIDLTGPFEVLSRLPNANYRLYGARGLAVRDTQGLRLVADAEIGAASALDVLHVPGGPGQEALMDVSRVLGWIARQPLSAPAVSPSARARYCWAPPACWVFAAGVTAGIDGALCLAAALRGRAVAEAIQLHMVYAPEPPFDSGTPETVPPAILSAARADLAPLTAAREACRQAAWHFQRRRRVSAA